MLMLATDSTENKKQEMAELKHYRASREEGAKCLRPVKFGSPKTQYSIITITTFLFTRTYHCLLAAEVSGGEMISNNARHGKAAGDPGVVTEDSYTLKFHIEDR